MEAVQITAESGLVEDQRCQHFSPPTPPPSGRELTQICDVNSSMCVMPVQSAEGLWSAACLSMPTDVTRVCLTLLIQTSHQGSTQYQPYSVVLLYSHAPYPFRIQQGRVLCGKPDRTSSVLLPVISYCIFFVSNLVEEQLFHRTRNWNTCFWQSCCLATGRHCIECCKIYVALWWIQRGSKNFRCSFDSEFMKLTFAIFFTKPI